MEGSTQCHLIREPSTDQPPSICSHSPSSTLYYSLSSLFSSRALTYYTYVCASTYLFSMCLLPYSQVPWGQEICFVRVVS